MSVTAIRKDKPNTSVTFRDIEKIGPGSLAGEYLRQFWHPVFHSHELPVSRALPIRILGENFTLYRGASGKPFVVASRCAHRSMLLHAGWVEGDDIRCFYHGWKFNGQGQCMEQPVEPKPFCEKVKIKAYPTQEYLGLVFAYFGEGEPPELPRFPMFESKDVVLSYDSYTRACHFFNNLENAPDINHIAFAHRSAGLWDQNADAPELSADETEWGATYRARRPSGKRIVSQFCMPTIFYARGVPDDPEVGYREFLAFWTAHDDDRHTQFSIAMKKKGDPVTERYLKRRDEKLAREDLDREKIAKAILAGTMTWNQVDPQRVNLIFLQDDVAQGGVGLMSDREQEMLGRSDVGVSLARKLWLNELRKFASGQPLRKWKIIPEKLEVVAEF